MKSKKREEKFPYTEIFVGDDAFGVPRVGIKITEVMTLRGTFLSAAKINAKINTPSRRDVVGAVPYKV